MDAVGKDAAEVESLIAKWDLNTVSDIEARKTKDYLLRKVGFDYCLVVKIIRTCFRMF